MAEAGPGAPRSGSQSRGRGGGKLPFAQRQSICSNVSTPSKDALLLRDYNTGPVNHVGGQRQHVCPPRRSVSRRWLPFHILIDMSTPYLRSGCCAFFLDELRRSQTRTPHGRPPRSASRRRPRLPRPRLPRRAARRRAAVGLPRVADGTTRGVVSRPLRRPRMPQKTRLQARVTPPRGNVS